MERKERGLHPVPSGPDPDGGDAGPATEDSLFADLAQAEHPEQTPHLWLSLLCRLLRARRATLLLGAPDRGPFSVGASWPEGDAAGARSLVAAAEQVLIKRLGFLRLPGRSDGELASLDGGLVAEPVLLGGRLHGAAVFEIPPRPDADLEAIRSRVRLAFGWLDAHLQRQRMAAEEQRKGQLEVVLGLLAAALEGAGFQGAVTTFATELATELGCDRVSVGFHKRRSVKLRGLSHSALFGKKTNLIRAIEGAMDEALDQQATVVFPSSDEVLARADHAHRELSRQFGSASLCSVPLVRSGEAVGAITAEREAPFDPPTVMLLEVVAALAGPVLEDLRREDRWIATKVLGSLEAFLGRLVGPRHVLTKLVTLAVTGGVLLLAVADGTHRVTADSIVEPEVQRATVAPFDGYIGEAPTRPGDVVQEGALLASLDDRDLALEEAKWESEFAKALKQYRAALAERDAAESEIQAAAVDEARAELDLIRDRMQRTELRAPFDGIVVSGDLTQRLGAPVKRGEVLYEVAPLDSFRLHLKVDERNIDQIVVGQEGRLILTSQPDEPVSFVVTKMTLVSEAEEGRNTFRVEAQPVGAAEPLRPGLEGVAKVEVGRRRLLWIWTHEAVDWLRLKLWSWTP